MSSHHAVPTGRDSRGHQKLVLSALIEEDMMTNNGTYYGPHTNPPLAELTVLLTDPGTIDLSQAGLDNHPDSR